MCILVQLQYIEVKCCLYLRELRSVMLHAAALFFKGVLLTITSNEIIMFSNYLLHVSLKIDFYGV